MRHFPFGKALFVLVFSGAFFACGQVVAESEGVPVALTYFLRGIGFILLLGLLELRVTGFAVRRERGLLEVSRRRWWWPVRKHEVYPVEDIARIVLRDLQRGWKKSDVGVDYLGSRHNWELVAETAGGAFALLPQGQALRGGGRKVGSALAVALGVRFGEEGHSTDS